MVEDVYRHERPLADIAAELGCSKSLVSRVCTGAIARLRRRLRRHLDEGGR